MCVLNVFILHIVELVSGDDGDDNFQSHSLDESVFNAVSRSSHDLQSPET
jgi:hypothetical protein